MEKRNKGTIQYFVNEENEVVARVCTRCNETKHIDDFLKKKDGFAGRFSHCYECDKKLKADWRSKNREKEVERVRKWCSDPINNQKKKEYAKQYKEKQKGF